MSEAKVEHSRKVEFIVVVTLGTGQQNRMSYLLREHATTQHDKILEVFGTDEKVTVTDDFNGTMTVKGSHILCVRMNCVTDDLSADRSIELQKVFQQARLRREIGADPLTRGMIAPPPQQMNGPFGAA